MSTNLRQFARFPRRVRGFNNTGIERLTLGRHGRIQQAHEEESYREYVAWCRARNLPVAPWTTWKAVTSGVPAWK